MKTKISPCQIQDTTEVKFAFSMSIWKYSYEFTHWAFRSYKTNRTKWNNSKRSYLWHCRPSLSVVNNNKSKIPLYHNAILFMLKVNHSQRKPVFKLARFRKLPLFPVSNRKTCSTWERIWPTSYTKIYVYVTVNFLFQLIFVFSLFSNSLAVLPYP